MVTQSTFLRCCISQQVTYITKTKLSAAIALFTIRRICFDCHIIGDNLPVLSLKNIMKPPWETPLSRLL